MRIRGTMAAMMASAGLLLATLEARPQEPTQMHQVVFEVTTDNPEQWEAVLNNMENVQKAFGAENTKIEVVAHGKGLGLVMKTNAARAERLQKLSEGGVVLAACENTMRRKDIHKEALLPFATTVDSGIAEVVRKQEADWAYIKSGS